MKKQEKQYGSQAQVRGPVDTEFNDRALPLVASRQRSKMGKE